MSLEFKYVYTDTQGNILTEISHKTQEPCLNEVLQEFRQFLLGIGYHPDSVNEYIEAN